MKKYISSNNIEKIFELISGGTVHKKDPIILMGDSQINLAKLLTDLVGNAGLDINDYVVNNTKYTVSVDVIDGGTYYMYPLYEHIDEENSDNNYCIYTFSSSTLSSGKICKNINQDPVEYISNDGIVQRYVYLLTKTSNKDMFHDYVGEYLSENFIKNNFMFYDTFDMKTKEEINNLYIGGKFIGSEDADYITEKLDLRNNHISFINVII